MKRFLFVVILVAFMFLYSVSQAHVLDGAKEFNGHYYKVFEFKLDWEQAKKFCESVGGHLATIDTDEENIPLRGLLIQKNLSNSNYWLGGYKVQKTWKWIITNKTFDSSWDKKINYGVGNDLGTNYDRLSIENNTSLFSSLKHDDKCSFICEWENKESAHESNL